MAEEGICAVLIVSTLRIGFLPNSISRRRNISLYLLLAINTLQSIGAFNPHKAIGVHLFVLAIVEVEHFSYTEVGYIHAVVTVANTTRGCEESSGLQEQIGTAADAVEPDLNIVYRAVRKCEVGVVVRDCHAPRSAVLAHFDFHAIVIRVHRC